MEPPDVYEGFDLWPDMNEHYSKEDAYERLLRESSLTRKKKMLDFDTDDYMTKRGYDQMYARKKMLHTKQQNFDMMWPLVHAVCESLMHEPHMWEFQQHRFKHKQNEVEFWCHEMKSPVTETFNMGRGATQTLFNLEQGEALLEAAKIARYAAPSDLQRELISRFGLNSAPVVDERHILHLPKMTFWQRLKFLVTASCKV